MSAVNTKAGTTLTGDNTPEEIASVIENMETDIKHTIKVQFQNQTTADNTYTRGYIQVYVDGSLKINQWVEGRNTNVLGSNTISV